ncbi:MAG: hypothetical protein ACUVTD_08645 [Nitrososphaerales archaeon]
MVVTGFIVSLVLALTVGVVWAGNAPANNTRMMSASYDMHNDDSMHSNGMMHQDYDDHIDDTLEECEGMMTEHTDHMSEEHEEQFSIIMNIHGR